MCANVLITRPTLLLHPEICLRNISRMHEKMKAHGILFRPHFKTHQSRRIGHWFRELGTDRITVSSQSMARYFADDGWNDITVAFPVNILEKQTLQHLSATAQLNVLAEDPDTIKALDRIVNAGTGVFIKIDTGARRTGLLPENVQEIQACISAIKTSAHLQWRGFLSHAGQTYRVRRHREEIQAIYRTAIESMRTLRDLFASQHPDILISFGDTPGASLVEDFTGIDEMRPGNFVFYDLMQCEIGSCAFEDIAVVMACPVVAVRRERCEAVIYGGSIHLSTEHLETGDGVSYGRVFRYRNGWYDPDGELGYLRALSQEHGVIKMHGSSVGAVDVGDIVAVLPVHSCITAQCMGGYQDQDGVQYDHMSHRVF